MSLLEFSRSITRERFSAVIRKPVYTFTFDRFMTVTPLLFRKLVKAMDSRAVLISTATALKAFQLKFVELLHLLDQSHTETKQFQGKSKEKAKWLEQKKKSNGLLREQVQLCVNILKLLRIGTFIIDEVDLILHPLKSELNFPIGRKEPLDLTLNKSQKGLRWEIPLFLLDAVYYATEGRMTVPMGGSREAQLTLASIKQVLDDGYAQKSLQRTPHLVLLSRAFYHVKLKPLLARWIVIWMSFRQASGLNDNQMYDYLTLTKDGGDIKQKAQEVGIQEELLADEVMKLLNLAHDWLHSYLPFCFSEDSRVLTDRGFLYLDEVRAHLRLADDGLTVVSSTVRFACYNEHEQRLEYHAPTQFILRPHGRQRMVEFTQAQEQPSWSSQADEYGRVAGKQMSNRVSLLVTEDHDMYAQQGKQNGGGTSVYWRRKNKQEIPPAKIKARNLLSDRPLECIRFHAHAAAGTDGLVAEDVDCEEEADDDDDLDDIDERRELASMDAARLATYWHETRTRLPFVDALGLTTVTQVHLFLELYGFWLVDGSLQYTSASGGYNGVRFSQKKQTDNAWLLRTIPLLGVAPHHLRVSPCTNGQTELSIIDPRWFKLFDTEYGRKYTRSTYYVAPGTPLSRARTVSSVSSSSASAIDLTADSDEEEDVMDVEVEDDDDTQLLEDKLIDMGVQPPNVKSAKWFWYWVLRWLTRTQTRRVLRGYRRADGCWKNFVPSERSADAAAALDPRRAGRGNSTSKSLFTSSVQMRDELVVACLHAGFTAYFRLTGRCQHDTRLHAEAQGRPAAGRHHLPGQDCGGAVRSRAGALFPHQDDSGRVGRRLRSSHQAGWRPSSQGLPAYAALRDGRTARGRLRRTHVVCDCSARTDHRTARQEERARCGHVRITAYHRRQLPRQDRSCVVRSA